LKIFFSGLGSATLRDDREKAALSVVSISLNPLLFAVYRTISPHLFLEKVFQEILFRTPWLSEIFLPPFSGLASESVSGGMTTL